jgi:hypothetical protein
MEERRLIAVRIHQQPRSPTDFCFRNRVERQALHDIVTYRKSIEQ